MGDVEEEPLAEGEGIGGWRQTIWAWAWGHKKRRIRQAIATEGSVYGMGPGTRIVSDRAPEPPPPATKPISELYDRSPGLKKGK